jgi:hypothetical protein
MKYALQTDLSGRFQTTKNVNGRQLWGIQGVKNCQERAIKIMRRTGSIVTASRDCTSPLAICDLRPLKFPGRVRVKGHKTEKRPEKGRFCAMV